MALKLKGSTSGFTAIDAPAVAGDNTLVLPGGNGTSGQYLQTNGSGTLSWATVSSLSNAEDGAGTDFEFNSGYGSNATAYGCRAWVNFNGTGTVAIRGSGNVSSITDNTTGEYTINFQNALTDANYSFVSCAERNAGQNPIISKASGGTNTTGALQIECVDQSNTSRDFATVCIAIFR